MLYLPETTSEAVYLEATNPDGSTKWWVGAFAVDGVPSRDLTFTCWGNHPNVPDAIAQGKTLATGLQAKQMYRAKLEEKELKGYTIVSTFDGKMWTNPKSHIPLPVRSVIPGQKEGSLVVSSSDSSLVLDLHRTIRGFRLDHYEWKGNGTLNGQPVFPKWQTLYSSAETALAAIKAVQESRLQQGGRVLTDKIPWSIGEFVDPNLFAFDGVLSGWIEWDF